MNIRNRTVVIAVVIFLLGIFIGAFLSFRVTMEHAFDQSVMADAINAEIAAHVLRGFRENDQDGALKLQEVNLDRYVLSLRASDSYSERTKSAMRRAIQAVKEYRAKHPRKTEFPGNDSAVDNILNAKQNGEER